MVRCWSSEWEGRRSPRAFSAEVKRPKLTLMSTGLGVPHDAGRALSGLLQPSAGTPCAACPGVRASNHLRLVRDALPALKGERLAVDVHQLNRSERRPGLAIDGDQRGATRQRVPLI